MNEFDGSQRSRGVRKLPLTTWTLCRMDGPSGPDMVGIGHEIVATAPGCVHTDLSSAGLIPEPTGSDHELHLGWIGRSSWTYRTALDGALGSVLEDGERATLEFDGIDTAAVVTVGGSHLAATANMHRRRSFDVTDRLRAGGSEVVVAFDAQEDHARRERSRLGTFPNAYPEPFNAVRKMACNFGWDWGPKLVTAGIWRDARLVTWRGARIRSVVSRTDVDAASGTVQVSVDLEVDEAALGGQALVVDIHIAGSHSSAVVDPGARGVELTVVVDDVERWWPAGMGVQHRYRLDVHLARGDGGSSLDSRWAMVGFRKIELDTSPDEHGTAFAFVVNGRRIFVRGANWIPDRVFPHLVDRARVRSRIVDAVESNMHLLRVWGGGTYESDDFYDCCDELGVMVWQDFLFVCAAYPEDEGTAAEVEAEARDNVRRLASHPSLVLWNGNNENIWGHEDWGWREVLDGRAWGRGYYEHLLPRIVDEEDGTRPYWPGTPFSGDWEVHPNDPDHGTMHLWEVWNALDYTECRRWIPRFAAEYGYQAPSQWSTLERCIGAGELRLDSPVLALHQKAIDGDVKMDRGLQHRFPEVTSFDDWHYLTQVNQARAFATGIEHFRSHRGRCMGSVIWQLNDCWPAVSWSVVDGDGRRKPAWYTVRRCYDRHLITIQPEGGGGLRVACVNDGGAAWDATMSLELRGLDGSVFEARSVDVACSSDDVVSIVVPDAFASGVGADRLIVARMDGCQAVWFSTIDRDIEWRPAHLDIELEVFDGVGDESDRVSATIVADTTVRDLVLAPDRLASSNTVTDSMITLLPGEPVVVGVLLEHGWTAASLCSPPVLRCINDVIAGPTAVSIVTVDRRTTSPEASRSMPMHPAASPGPAPDRVGGACLPGM